MVSFRGRGGLALSMLVLYFALGNAVCAIAGDAPRWFVDGRPTTDAAEAVQLLQAAGTDGLEPEDYQASALAQQIGAAGRPPFLSEDSQQALSAALTRAMEQLLSDVHVGRINPRDIHAAFDVPPKRLEPASYLRDAVARHALTDALRAAAPQLPLYIGLRQALAVYRTLEKDPALQRPLPPAPGSKIRPGAVYPGVTELFRRLISLGDLPADTEVGTRYEGALVDGVRAFQGRHGLTADGVIGKATFEQLNTPLAARIRQIEITLERLRWTPLLLSERMIVVNVPEFALRAYDLRDGGARLRMNVIVGKALNTRTPLFVEDMRFIEFSPYWNIPPSIARAETVPRLLRDPAYFDKEGLEFVSGDGAVINGLSAANIEALKQGKLRIRQRPGPTNALGDIKFIFPNSDNIYLHHTPAIGLFGRDRRDFSHGCIRLEDPVALAKFVLQDQPEWSEERIRTAMASGKSSTLRLDHPIPVVIAYATVVMSADRKIHFFQDVYGNDRLLDQALKARERARRSN